jgi:hypothetical protein
VVIVGGEACAHLERGGKRLLTFPAAARRPEWARALADLVTASGSTSGSGPGGGRVRRLQVETIDGERATASPVAVSLREVGFVDGYKGLTLGT